MTRARLRQIRALAARVPERKARELYEEVHGAQVSDVVPEERVRAATIEACDELLDKEAGK